MKEQTLEQALSKQEGLKHPVLQYVDSTPTINKRTHGISDPLLYHSLQSIFQIHSNIQISDIVSIAYHNYSQLTLRI